MYGMPIFLAYIRAIRYLTFADTLRRPHLIQDKAVGLAPFCPVNLAGTGFVQLGLVGCVSDEFRDGNIFPDIVSGEVSHEYLTEESAPFGGGFLPDRGLFMALHRGGISRCLILGRFLFARKFLRHRDGLSGNVEKILK